MRRAVVRRNRLEAGMDSHRKTVGWPVLGVILVLGCELPQDGVGAEGRSQLELESAVLTSCSQESDCPSQLACVAGACQPCSVHDQCESDTCDAYAATSLGPGACIN